MHIQQDKATKTIYNRLKGGVLGLAIGDAMGVPYEFENRKYLQQNPVNGYTGYKAHGLPPGTWSDDTSLTLATMDSLCEESDIIPLPLMKKFTAWYKHNKYSALGQSFGIEKATKHAILKHLANPYETEFADDNLESNGNGSLMRMFPVVAYIYLTTGYVSGNELKLIHAASSITHKNIISLMACGIYTCILIQVFQGQPLHSAISFGLNNAKRLYVGDSEIKYFNRLYDPDFKGLSENSIKTSEYVVDTLEAVIWCLLNTSKFRDSILKAINLGGDTATITSITGGISGAYYGYKAIPKEWIQGLKRKKYIVTMINKFYNSFTMGL